MFSKSLEHKIYPRLNPSQARPEMRSVPLLPCQDSCRWRSASLSLSAPAYLLRTAHILTSMMLRVYVQTSIAKEMSSHASTLIPYQKWATPTRLGFSSLSQSNHQISVLSKKRAVLPVFLKLTHDVGKVLDIIVHHDLKCRSWVIPYVQHHKIKN